MSDFHEGDLVEATLGETVIRGRVTGCSGDWLGNSRRQIPHLIADGFTLKTIERAKPALPTERGFYLSCNGSDVLYQGEDGTWSDDAKYGVEPVEVSRKHAPLTRLEPVPETAKKVLDALGEYLDGQLSGRTKNDIIGNLAAEFGVTGGIGE